MYFTNTFKRKSEIPRKEDESFLKKKKKNTYYEKKNVHAFTSWPTRSKTENNMPARLKKHSALRLQCHLQARFHRQKVYFTYPL